MTKAACPITLVVITFNEEQNIGRCLQAADFCSERLVIDSGSTDRTTEIASAMGAKVIQREWTGYRDQKQFGSEQAAHEWVLCIDADEVVSPELAANIQSEMQKSELADAYEINRHSYYAGKLINHSGWYPQWRMFLYKKGAARWSGSEPHTTVEFLGGRAARLSGDLFHYTYSDIRHHMSKLVNQARDSAAGMYESGKRASFVSLTLRGPWAFLKSYILERGFLDGFYGFVICASAGFYTFLKYAMLFERHRRHESR